jgi:hypothetical protein
MAIYTNEVTGRMFCQFVLNRKSFKKHLPLGTTKEEAEGFEKSWRRKLIAAPKPQNRDHELDANGFCPRDGKDFVYVVRAARFYKIGFTTNLKKRLSSLGTSQPFKLTLVVAIMSETAELLEKQLHRKFAKKRVNGEWFRLNDQDLGYLKQVANEANSAISLPPVSSNPENIKILVEMRGIEPLTP